MVEFDTPTVDTVAQFFEQRNNDESGQERQWWEVAIRPPEEYDDDPREVAERLYADLHAHGQLSFEIHSNGPEIALKIVAPNRPTAETVARHVRSEVGARTDVREASVPISSDDPIAAAEFSIQKDVIFPLETVRTTDSVGQLHHLLDTFAADDIRGVYQVSVEPVEGDWTARRSRSLPESIPEEQDPEAELKRAGLAMVPVFAVSIWLSPWPLPTALIVGCALVMAATVGEGVSIPEYRTAGEIARQHRERTQERHGAQSSVTKQAKQTADEIIEQAGSFGWKASIRLVVSHDENRMVAADIRDSLVAEIESAFSSETTGQELTATRSTGSDAREQLAHVRTRHLGDRSTAEIVSRLLGQGTRRDLHVGPGEFAVLGYFPGDDGGGGDAREFASPTETSKSLPDSAPSFTRPAAADGGEIATPDYQLNNPTVEESGRHGEYGEVQLKVNDDGEIFAGEHLREVVETSTRDSNVVLGYVEDNDSVEEVAITPDQLNQHLFVCGASGAGKSTVAIYLVLQHAHAGRGFCVIDPHDDFIDDIRRRLPAHRTDDVILVDPEGDSDRTVTINFLDVEDDSEEAVNAAVSDLVGVLKQGVSNLGDRMEDSIRTVARGMIRSEEDFSLIDMQELVTSESRREEFAEQMRREGFEHIARGCETIAELSNGDLAPVARLFNQWVMSPTSRQIIEQTESSFSFQEAVANDKIILVKNDLSDDDLARQVGTTVYRGVMRAAEERPRDERTTYPMVIDEVDDIYCPEMKLGDDLGNARKYGVSLTLLTQLPKRLKPIQDELETNCKTYVTYACPSPKQARTIASMYDCEQSTIGKLGDFVSQIQLDINGERSGPYETQSPPPMPTVRTEAEAVEEIDKPSLERYGRDRVSDASELVEEDDEDGEEETDTMDDFMRIVADAADAGDLEEDKQYSIVHEGKSNETLRINPSRVIEALDHDGISSAEEITSISKERVDDESSYINGHRKRTPPISRALGASMSDLTDALSGVDRGMF